MVLDPVPRFTSQRYILSYVAFFGFLWAYSMRFNLSVAIVCMVKRQQVNVTSNETVQTGVEKCQLGNGSSKSVQEGEFDWDRPTQGLVLSSFFWGYIVTQLPAGWLADMYGSKMVFGVGMTITSVATLLTPVAARGHYIAVIFLRVVMGLGTGVMFPAMTGLWARWAPLYERTKLIAVSYAGTIGGNIFAFFISGVLCEYSGWASVFYVIGGLSLSWCVFWFVLVYDTPADHPRICSAEKKFIEKNTSKSVKEDADERKKDKIPWLMFLKSMPLWAILVTHVCNDGVAYTMMTNLPIYMKDILYFDMKQNGAFNALPYIGMFIFSVVGGELADLLRKRYSTTIVRKVFQTVALIVPACFTVAMGHVECTDRMVAVAFLIIAITFSALSRCGYCVNHVDVAPRYSAILMGISNTMSTIPGVVAPIYVGHITKDKSRESWLTVFYICAGVYTFAAIFYVIFGSGEEQEWAKIDHSKDNEKRAELATLTDTVDGHTRKVGETTDCSADGEKVNELSSLTEIT